MRLMSASAVRNLCERRTNTLATESAWLEAMKLKPHSTWQSVVARTAFIACFFSILQEYNAV